MYRTISRIYNGLRYLLLFSRWSVKSPSGVCVYLEKLTNSPNISLEFWKISVHILSYERLINSYFFFWRKLMNFKRSKAARLWLIVFMALITMFPFSYFSLTIYLTSAQIQFSWSGWKRIKFLLSISSMAINKAVNFKCSILLKYHLQ